MARHGKSSLTKGELQDLGVLEVWEDCYMRLNGTTGCAEIVKPLFTTPTVPTRSGSYFIMRGGKQLSWNRVKYAWFNEECPADCFISAKTCDKRICGDVYVPLVNERIRKNRSEYYFIDLDTKEIYNTWSDIIRAGKTIHSSYAGYLAIKDKKLRIVKIKGGI